MAIVLTNSFSYCPAGFTGCQLRRSLALTDFIPGRTILNHGAGGCAVDWWNLLIHPG
jgi:hypothetical protein